MSMERHNRNHIGLLQVEWSRNRCHVNLKDQGRDPKHLMLNISTTVEGAAMGQIPLTRKI